MQSSTTTKKVSMTQVSTRLSIIEQQTLLYGKPECPICMDDIDDICNKITTECGHTFHCSCLMRNVAHNGFACPYCRCVMADAPPDTNDIIEDRYHYGIDDEDDEDDTIFDLMIEMFPLLLVFKKIELYLHK